jgi:Tfp pilus assembly protein PilF
VADSPEELMALAQRYVERGWYRRAVGLLRQATQLAPFNADAWNELGFAYRNVENYNKSAQAYDRALSLEPEHLGALNYQGFMFLETNDPDSARDNLAQLGELCGSCSEYQLLKDAIDAL